jgi:hypothetical protein
MPIQRFRADRPKYWLSFSPPDQRTPPGGLGYRSRGSGTRPQLVGGGAKVNLPIALSIDELRSASGFDVRGHFGARVQSAAR